jgi:hypothetical protein
VSWLTLAALLTALGAAAQEGGSEARPVLIQPGGLPMFYVSEGPLSFVTPTPGELPRGARDLGEVKGRSCQHGLSIPLAASIRATTVSGAIGNGGYRKVLAAMRKQRPELAGIYDVKVDVQILSILGFYRRTCTEVAARGFTVGP